MRRVEVRWIRSHGVRIAGGWHALVPDASIDASFLKEMALRFQRLGAPVAVAEARARAAMQRMFEGHYVTHLRMFTARKAREYVDRYGDLRGFDPERLQAGFIPRDFHGGGRSLFLERLMQEMRDTEISNGL